jgi:hypothetical protein
MAKWLKFCIQMRLRPKRVGQGSVQGFQNRNEKWVLGRDREWGEGKRHEESNLDPPPGDGGAPAPRSGRQPIYSRTSSEAIQTVSHHVEYWDTIKQNWGEESLISRRHTSASLYTSMTIFNSWPSCRHRSRAPRSVLGCGCLSRVRRNSSSPLPPCGPGKPCLRRR